MGAYDTALVRGVPASFTDALRRQSGPALDVDRARRQHRAYVEVLAHAGYEIHEIAADEGYPDCVFIEDAAIVIGSTVVATRSGAESRRGEVGPVIDELSAMFTVASVDPPGILDGGDVIHLGRTLYVGITDRTNAEGVEQLTRISKPLGVDVVTVEVHDALHLKSVVLPLGADTVLVSPRSVDEEALKGLRIVYEPEVERHRTSALPLRDGGLMVTESTPATAAMLTAAGFAVQPVDVSELLAADGGLTCLSILYRGPPSLS